MLILVLRNEEIILLLLRKKFLRRCSKIEINFKFKWQIVLIIKIHLSKIRLVLFTYGVFMSIMKLLLTKSRMTDIF